MPKSNPKVSVIIPVYNGSNYLREAIDSALAQSYRNIEIIVINDGSNDDGKTETIAKSYGSKIRYSTKENGGVATALNLGIQNMTGEYFSWLSHDDVYYPHKIEVQIECLRYQERKDVILYSDYDIIDSRSNVIHETIIPHYEPEQFLYELIQCSFLHGCTLLIPKVCFENVGLFNEKLPTTQDYELWVRMAKKYDFIHLPKKLIQARSHAEQGSRKASHFEELNTLYRWWLNELQVKKISQIYGISASNFYLKLAEIYKQRQLFGAYQAAIDKTLKLSNREHMSSLYMKMITVLEDAVELLKRCFAVITAVVKR